MEQTYQYNKTVFEILEVKYEKGNAVLFARSATAGGQQFPVHWGGDCRANFESMAETLRGGLSLCLSGFGFWSHDIGGFFDTAASDVYKRWVAFGLLSSHSRLHGCNSYRVPWLFDEEAVDVLRHFTRLKSSLMPYLFGAACEAPRRGTPLMRAMVLEFTEDPACDYLDRQYMLGESLLVAPVFSEDGTVSYYLPDGVWTNYFTGEKVKGGCWKQEKHGFMSLPLMVKPNSIIAVGNNEIKPDYDYADGVTLHVFELKEGIKTVTVYGVDGNVRLEVNVEHKGDSVCIEAPGASKPWSVLMRGLNDIRGVKGAQYVSQNMGVHITPDNYSKCELYLK